MALRIPRRRKKSASAAAKPEKPKRTPKPKRTAKPRAAKPNAGRTRKVAKPSAKVAEQPDAARYEHVVITDLDVLLLQTDDSGVLDVEDVVFSVFESEAERRREGSTWLAFHRSGMPHYAGKSVWLGLSKSVPAAVVDLIQAVLRAADMDVERDMGRVVHLDLNPFARLSEDGLEILVPAALVGDPAARRGIERGGVKVIARGYTVAPSKATSLNELFFGSGE